MPLDETQSVEQTNPHKFLMTRLTIAIPKKPNLMNRRASKVVLITGCSSGIGLCVAQELAQRGYKVIATARQRKDVLMLQELGLEGIQLDLQSSESIQRAVALILDKTGGKIYALFNNGAYGQPGAIEDLPTDALRRQFETNLFGWHELTRLILPIMRAQNEGRIIQNSSILGLVALKYRGAYNASKFALEGLSDTLRLELYGSNIFISLIEPGPIESRFRMNAFNQWKLNIDASDSAHKPAYNAMEERLTKEGPAVPFTLPPKAVLEKVIHALEHKRPKARYYVTLPTYLLATLKRILPISAMDWVLRRI